MNAGEVVSKLVPVLALIALGNVFRRIRFLLPGTAGDLKKLIVNVGLPALLFTAFAETSFRSDYVLIFFAVFAVCAFMLAAGMFVEKRFGIGNPFYPALWSGFETGMMGYSLFVTVFGRANMFKLAVIDLGQVTFVFFVLFGFLRKRSGAAAAWKDLALDFLKSPVILSILLGIAAGSTGFLKSFSGTAFTGLLSETLGIASSVTVPLICIVIGYELEFNPAKLRLPLLTAISRMLVLAGFAFLIDSLIIRSALGLDSGWSAALYTMFLLPPPFVVPIFMTGDSGEDRQTVLTTLSVHILLSLPAFLLIALSVRVPG